MSDESGVIEFPGQEVVRLEGDALRGVGPPRLHALYDALPQTVRLGRIRTAARPTVLRMSAFLDESRATVPPPPTVSRSDKALKALARMYLNDQFGICVVAAKLHLLGLLAGAESDLDLEATDAEAYAQYQSICGPGDNGCNMAQVLDVMRSKGIMAGGKNYPIDGYVSCDWRNKLEVQVALYLFGAIDVGMNLPQAWTQSAVWDVTGTRIVGGHNVLAIGYQPDGVIVSSWGRLYRMTYAAFAGTRWNEEAYVPLAPLWYARNNVAPCGVNVDALKSALAQLGGGTIPPIPDPTPVPIPVPVPAEQIVTLTGFDAAGKAVANFKRV